MKGEFLNAKTTECCAWTKPGALFNNGILVGGKQNDYCGTQITTKKNPKNKLRDTCCNGEKSDSTGDCDSAGWPKGPAFRHILNFAASEKKWLNTFSQAWWKAVENGHKGLQRSNGFAERMKTRAEKMAKRKAANKAKGDAMRKSKMGKKKNGRKGKKSGEN